MKRVLSLVTVLASASCTAGADPMAPVPCQAADSTLTLRNVKPGGTYCMVITFQQPDSVG